MSNREVRRKRNERYARMYKMYLSRGMSPSKALKSVAQETGVRLASVREWVRGVAYNPPTPKDRESVKERREIICEMFKAERAEGVAPLSAIADIIKRTGYKKPTVRHILTVTGLFQPATSYRNAQLRRKNGE